VNALVEQSSVSATPAGCDAVGLLGILERTLTRGRPDYLPNELYVSVSTTPHLSSFKGVYKLDTPRLNRTSGNETENNAGQVYVKTLEHNVEFRIAKEVMTTKHPGTGLPTLAEEWVLSSINGNKSMRLYHTELRIASRDRCPQPTAKWFYVRRDPQGEACDMEVLCQWSDDQTTYARRNVDYAPVNSSPIDSSCKMDVGAPNTGGNKSVQFEENNSDSASDEAIAGSDHEGGDEQTSTDRH